MIDSQSRSMDSQEQSLRTLGRSISLSQGEFAIILLHCNYESLRQHVTEQLPKYCAVPFQELFLSLSTQNLYQAIQEKIDEEGSPTALIVSGLEKVKDLDSLFLADNNARDEFRKHFAFPLVLWVTHDVQQKLRQFAPDLKGFAATPIEFGLTTEQLIDFLQENIDLVFATVLAARDNIFGQTIEGINAAELYSAGQELHDREIELEPELKAGLDFVLGRLADNSRPKPRRHYERSLELYQQANELEKSGHVSLFLGRWWRYYAENNRNEFDSAINRAQEYVQQCIETFEQANKPELVAKYINAWTEILHRRSRWSELEKVAIKARTLHQKYPDNFKQARAWGFLAEVALSKSDWTEAKKMAQQALALMYSETKAIVNPTAEQKVLLHWENSFHRGWYLFSLGKAERNLGQVEKAITTLETARDTMEPNNDPGLYIGILGELRDCYFQEGEYLTAFELKKQKNAIKSQFNFSAFVGAGHLQPKQHIANVVLPTIETENTSALEFAASGREQDIKHLIGRMYRDDIQLTVIYGQSGVGKSSIIKAGLIPVLKKELIDTRRVVPILQRVYRNWIGELAKLLGIASSSSIESSPPSPPSLGGTRLQRPSKLGETGVGGSSKNLVKEKSDGESSTTSVKNLQKSPRVRGFPKGYRYAYRGQESTQDQKDNLKATTPILEKLRKNSAQNLLTVLIFDQFEEFFFNCQEPSQRKEFYEFLQRCLALPYVKVILSLREDYLHYLLECNRLTNLEVINNNILDKNILYYLGNFSTNYAKSVIESLTKHTQFSLEPKLVEQLVQDLAAEMEEVRPIELQVVGAQLQAEDIKTLEKYQKSGTKEELVERYLGEVVKDCGEANKEIAQLILYLLTDEKNTRPIKTQEELEEGLDVLGVETEEEPLDLVLKILVDSGLLFIVPAPKTKQYQLVHDYLAAFVRHQQEDGLIKDLREAKKREQKTQAKLNRFFKYAFAGSFAFILGLIGLTFTAMDARKNAEIEEIKALSSSATVLLASHQEIEGLIETIKLGTQLKKTFGGKANEKIDEVTAMQKVVYAIRERNRLEEHVDTVESVSFSPDGKTIASAGSSGDATVKLWSIDGKLLHTIRDHRSNVTSVSFGPDGKTIASSSHDGTVKLWNLDGTLLNTLHGHTSWVLSVNFSPNGETIASASADDTVKLWNLDGELITTIQCLQEGINEVSFSPDGKTIASAGNNGTIKLWSLDGELRRTFDAHSSSVLSVNFSPDGKTIVSSSKDKTVKLWNLDGTLQETFQGHSDEIWSVRFSPDGKTIASSSEDKTVKLWKLDGTLLKTIQGHDGTILEINFSPDGKTLASASGDYTVRLWSLDETLFKTIPAHDNYVQSVSFSPDGETLASASNDLTVKLWSPDGTLLQTLCCHGRTVRDISFSPDGNTIASASWDGTVKLWNPDGTLLQTLPGHDVAATSVSFSSDGKTIVSGGSDSNVKLWSLNGNLLKIFEDHNNAVHSVNFSSDGKIIASSSSDQTIKLWSLDGILIKTFEDHNDLVYSVGFSSDGKTLASASFDNTVKIWNLDGTLLKTITAHSDNVRNVSFSPDGKTLASASKDGTIKIWNLDGKLLKILQGHQAGVLDISFSPDGKTLVSASNDKNIILWNLDALTMDVDKLLERGCNWLQDYLTNRPEKLEELETCKAQYEAQSKEDK
ncbi:MAG: hypothetical protein AAGA80_02325 [Cyanobacteria bacterium P01_F01_bin.143]